MSSAMISRRSLLGTGVLAAAAGAAALAACGGSDDAQDDTASKSTTSAPTSATVAPSTSSGRGASSSLPAFVPFEGPEPDLPATDSGVMAAYFHYPQSPVKTMAEPPGSGGTVTVMAQASAASVPDEGSNKVWQEMNKQLNVKLKFNSVFGSEYTNKLNTTIAGGDLPDLVQITKVPRLPDVLASKFQDLTEYLAGDAVKEYPNLAAIPPYIWDACLYNGRLYTFPASRGIVGFELLYRKDILEAKGLPTEINSGEDFQAICRELVDPKTNTYAFTQSPAAVLPFLREMLGAPYEWQEEGGKFVSALEAAQSKEAVSIAAQMWKDKLFHPDAFSGSLNPLGLFTSGAGPLSYYSYAVWQFYLREGASAEIDGYSVGAFIPPKYEGGGPAVKHLRNPVNTFSAMKKSSPDRVKELLGVVNYFAAPFGSVEGMTLDYGIEGRDYNLEGSDPVRTKIGQTEVALPPSYLVSSVPILYYPGDTTMPKEQHEFQVKTVPGGIKDPTIGLYSATAYSDGVTIGNAYSNTISDIIQGRKQMSDYDAAVQTWKKAGGDKIAAEYAESYAAVN